MNILAPGLHYKKKNVTTLNAKYIHVFVCQILDCRSVQKIRTYLSFDYLINSYLLERFVITNQFHFYLKLNLHAKKIKPASESKVTYRGSCYIKK